METEPTVFVVDDDQAVRAALRLLLEGAGIKAELFSTAREFLDNYTADRPGCLLLDVRMPGMSGLELQSSLSHHDIHLPVIIITGHGDVPMAVSAIKSGVMDFIEKPFSGQRLLERIREALHQDAKARQRRASCSAIAERIALLSPREKEVMNRVVAGQYNKVIAAQLGISVSTVEAHRKHIMQKLGTESLSDLIRMLAYYQKMHTGKP